MKGLIQYNFSLLTARQSKKLPNICRRMNLQPVAHLLYLTYITAWYNEQQTHIFIFRRSPPPRTRDHGGPRTESAKRLIWTNCSFIVAAQTEAFEILSLVITSCFAQRILNFFSIWTGMLAENDHSVIVCPFNHEISKRLLSINTTQWVSKDTRGVVTHSIQHSANQRKTKRRSTS